MSRAIIVVGILVAVASCAVGQEVGEVVPAQQLQQAMQMLLPAFRGIAEPPMELTPDPANAAGVTVQEIAIIACPAEGLKGAVGELPAAGLPAAVLFLRGVMPMKDGQTIAAAKAHTCVVAGQNVAVLWLQLKPAGDGVKLNVFGKKKEPLLTVEANPLKGTGDGIKVRIVDVADNSGAMQFDFAGKLRAKVRGGPAGTQ